MTACAGPEHHPLPRDIIEAAEDIYGWQVNGVGSPVYPPVTDDPDADAFYASLPSRAVVEDECDFCSEMLAESECEGWDWHCDLCKGEGRCPSCNGAPPR